MNLQILWFGCSIFFSLSLLSVDVKNFYICPVGLEGTI